MYAPSTRRLRLLNRLEWKGRSDWTLDNAGNNLIECMAWVDKALAYVGEERLITLAKSYYEGGAVEAKLGQSSEVRMVHLVLCALYKWEKDHVGSNDNASCCCGS